MLFVDKEDDIGGSCEAALGRLICSGLETVFRKGEIETGRRFAWFCVPSALPTEPGDRLCGLALSILAALPGLPAFKSSDAEAKESSEEFPSACLGKPLSMPPVFLMSRGVPNGLLSSSSN